MSGLFSFAQDFQVSGDAGRENIPKYFYFVCPVSILMFCCRPSPLRESRGFDKYPGPSY